MENISIIERTDSEGNVKQHIIIDRGNGEYTSMLKSTYDKQQAEQSTPIVTSDE